MKPFTIAIKDLKRSFRSAFSIIFMFVLPLLVTGMFYLMFGNLASNDEAGIPATKVVVANLDQGSDELGNLGDELIKSLNDEQLSTLMTISEVDSSDVARQKVDSQEAGVALIIPADFTATFSDHEKNGEIEFYQDPTLTVGPGIVASVVNQFVDIYAGIKIEVAEIVKQVEHGKLSQDQVTPLVGQYVALSQPNFDVNALIDSQMPQTKAQPNFLATLVGPIMGGMMIFYAFFTGVNTASSILHEEEEGTLPRLFTTPTSQREVLTGKFLSIGLNVIVQVVVLLIAARLLFGIHWGLFMAVAMIVIGIFCAATTFGILVCSLMKSTKQSGVIFGGLLTVTGMLGMMPIFSGRSGNALLTKASLLVPQGWACQALLASMNGAGIEKIYPSVLVLIAMSVVFFVIGVWRFQKRYA